MSDKNATERLLADEAGIARAAEILRSGGLVAVPTETVYGLAARADSDEAVAKIYAAKGRPSFNPLIVHVASVEQARAIAEFPGNSAGIAKANWPGALTLILPKRLDAKLADAVTAGLDTVAVRMPDNAVMRRVIELSGGPLAAPSANRSEAISPTSAEHVLSTLDGRIDAVIDGGPTQKGLESNILAIRQDGTWEELRAGPLTVEGLDHATIRRDRTGLKMEAPGQLRRHYSPGKPVRLNATEAKEGEFLIGFGPVAGDATLSSSGDLEDAAARLYSTLHAAAQSDKPRIAVAPIPEEGTGRAINDRLRRAAA